MMVRQLWRAAAMATLMAAGVCASAQAGGLSWSIGVQSGGPAYGGPAVVVTPPALYVAPAPLGYYRPLPPPRVVYAPPPAHWMPPPPPRRAYPAHPHFRGPHGHSHGHGPHGHHGEGHRR